MHLQQGRRIISASVTGVTVGCPVLDSTHQHNPSSHWRSRSLLRACSVGSSVYQQLLSRLFFCCMLKHQNANKRSKIKDIPGKGNAPTPCHQTEKSRPALLYLLCAHTRKKSAMLLVLLRKMV